jgi:Zn-dependent peptidase ImmA (M78 family)/transcriptional regulator with XRE-family HTH domain
METQLIEVGDRIRQRLPEIGMTQRALAGAVEMAPDALSRAMSAKRGFSLTEITRISEAIDVGITWLLTGENERNLFDLVARHAWNPGTRERSNPGFSGDSAVLEHIAHLYRQAFPEGAPASVQVPDQAAIVREDLGDGFVSNLAEAVEAVYDVDVVRMPGLSTDYSLRVAGRGVIVLNAKPKWFRSNWSLAHELAHLAFDHHGDGSESAVSFEGAADRFASELLLPRQLLDAQDWTGMSIDEVGQLIWAWGVSTGALSNRLSYLGIRPSEEISQALSSSTPWLVKNMSVRVDPALSNSRAMAERQQYAASRHFPSALVEALVRRTEAGEVDPEVLGFVLDLSVDEVFESFAVPIQETEAQMAERMLAGPASPEFGIEQLRTSKA